MSEPHTVPSKALLSEEGIPCQRLWWFRRETVRSSQERLTRWWVWEVLKEREEVGKHSRQRELFRSLAQQEEGSNSPMH